MSLELIVDKKTTCGGAGADTGKKGCQIEWGTPLHLIGMTKGTVIPKETEFNKTYIDLQIQAGVFIPLIGAESFDNESSEDSVTTNSRGVDRLNTLGLPKYKFTYEEGHEFYREMSKLTSFKSLDFIFADEEGNWRLAEMSSGDYKGFTAGQAIAMITTTKTLGGDPESKAFSIQLLDRIQWDLNYVFALRSALTFAPEEIDGVNGISIAIGTAPAALAVAIDFTATLKSDGVTPVEGLVLADILYTVDSIDGVATNLAEGLPGVYTLTIPAVGAGEVLGVQTFDVSVNKFVVINNGVLYRGDINTAIATA
jgi:hypothetical protein